MKTAIICCARNEELYIREWIQWHLDLGFDHIFIADNNDSDYNYRLDNIIQDYINTGRVTVYDYNNVEIVQMKCYNDIYQEQKTNYDWFLFIDVDEFLHFNQEYRNISSFLTEFDSYQMIMIYWRLFDDNNILSYTEEDVQKRFTHPYEFRDDHEIFKKIKTKCFLRGNLDYQILPNSSPHNLGTIECLRYTNVLKKKRNKYISLKQFIYDTYSVSEIRHYKYLSIEEFLMKRYLRKQDCYRGKVINFNFNAFWSLNKRTKEKYDKMILWLDRNVKDKSRWYYRIINKLTSERDLLV